MWVQLFLAIALSIVLLYVPGMLAAMPFSREWSVAIALAPLATTCMYSLLSIVLGNFGLYTTWLALFAPATLLGMTAFLLARWRRHGELDGKSFVEDLNVLLPYVLFGAVVCLVYFIKPLDGPASFAGSDFHGAITMTRGQVICHIFGTVSKHDSPCHMGVG